MRYLKIKNRSGSIDPFLIPLVIAAVLAVGFAGFGIWSYLQYQDQKQNVNRIVSQAVAEAETAQEEALKAEFQEEEKKPNRTYTGPSSLGAVQIKYPKTWSVYADESGDGSVPLDVILHPKAVPADTDTPYALMIEVLDSDYDDEARDYDKDIEAGDVTAKTIKKSGTAGLLLTGEIESDYTGVMAMFPIRDKTLKVWTRSEAYVKDFQKTVLPSLSFEK